MDKRYIIGFLAILIVISVSGCIGSDDADNENSTKVQEVSGNGITLLCPSSWVKASAHDNASVLAIADPDLKDSNGQCLINVNIEKKKISSSLDSEFSSTYTMLGSNSDYSIISEGNVSLGSYNGLEAMYSSNVNGTNKMHKAVWVQKDSDAYVILCSAPSDKFDSQSQIFDFIISNFKFA